MLLLEEGRQLLVVDVWWLWSSYHLSWLLAGRFDFVKGSKSTSWSIVLGGESRRRSYYRRWLWCLLNLDLLRVGFALLMNTDANILLLNVSVLCFLDFWWNFPGTRPEIVTCSCLPRFLRSKLTHANITLIIALRCFVFRLIWLRTLILNQLLPSTKLLFRANHVPGKRPADMLFMLLISDLQLRLHTLGSIGRLLFSRLLFQITCISLSLSWSHFFNHLAVDCCFFLLWLFFMLKCCSNYFGMHVLIMIFPQNIFAELQENF